jgi:hypothetical protein
VLVIATLTALAKAVIGLDDGVAFRHSAGEVWLFSLGIAMGLAIGLRLLILCLSSWRNIRRTGFTLAALAGLVIAFYSVEYVRGRWAWSRFKSEWEAKGEKFDFKAFVPPPVPADQNFAMAPVVVSSYNHVLDTNGHRIQPHDTNVVNRLRMPIETTEGGPGYGMGNWQKAQLTDLRAWQEYYQDIAQTTNLFPVPANPVSPAADVLTALSIYDTVIEELRQAAARPHSRFPLDYDNEEVFAILLPHLAPLKSCVTALRLRALAELEAGQSDQALADVTLALRLIEHLRHESFLITHLVRIALLQITTLTIWEGQVGHRWTDAQLAELEKQLATFNFAADYQASMRGEVVFQTATMDFLRRHPARLADLGDYGVGAERNTKIPGFPFRLVPSGWLYQNQVCSTRFTLEHFLPVADPGQGTFSPARAARGEELLSGLRPTPCNALCRIFLPSLGKSSRKFAQAQATVNLSRVACALERYRLANGKYPDSLNALAPQLLTAVPLDPIDGHSLRYVREDDAHFVLYSVGWNQTDDSGQFVVTRKDSLDPEKGDWTWRFPDASEPR